MVEDDYSLLECARETATDFLTIDELIADYANDRKMLDRLVSGMVAVLMAVLAILLAGWFVVRRKEQ